MTANLAADLAAIHAQLDAMAELKFDWDSYGARAIPPEPIAAAHALLDELAMAIRPSDGRPPSVVPHPWGGVSLEWHGGGLDLEVSILYDRCSYGYSLLDERGPSPIEDEVEDIPRATVLARLVRVLGEGSGKNGDAPRREETSDERSDR